MQGKPLIGWTLEAANKSKYIDHILVSTDSLDVKKIAEEYDADVPFIRPTELATDTADTISVIKHALSFFNDKFDIIILLQPTSPLRTVKHIDTAIEMLDSKIDAVVSVCELEHSPLWSNILPDSLYMTNFIKEEVKNLRSQDLPNYYRLNGSIYIARIKYFKEVNNFIANKTKAYIMSQSDSVDIDNEFDWQLAEFILSKKSNNK